MPKISAQVHRAAIIAVAVLGAGAAIVTSLLGQGVIAPEIAATASGAIQVLITLARVLSDTPAA